MKVKAPLTAALMAAVFVPLSASLSAQVQVVESQNRLLTTGQSAPTPQAVATAPSSPVANSGDLFFQLQTLQQEVQELRGLVEEQAYELKRLKQQRLDDYVNLDRRLSNMGGQTGAASNAGNGLSGNVSTDTVAAPATSTAATQTTAQAPDEMQRYRTAIDLVLSKKDYEQAIVAFNQYLRDFPQGRYAPNCQYWLGEIYLLQANLESAREWFSRLLAEFPEHGKAPDATFKLGTVYHKLGDLEQAKTLLTQVASGDSNAARLANSYLSDNFPQ